MNLSRHRYVNLLALCIGVIPVQVVAIWYRLSKGDAISIEDMLLFPLLFGGGNIILILFLNKFLLNEPLNTFSKGKGTWYRDIIAGIILALISFGIFFAALTGISPLLPEREPPSQEVLKLLTGLASNPLYLAIWLGPVVWLGVAAFEEMVRVFFMDCLWRMKQGKVWEIFSLVLVAACTGLIHYYQGYFAVVTIFVQGLVIGYLYYRWRRIWPLIIAHGLFDSLQIIMFVAQVR